MGEALVDTAGVEQAIERIDEHLNTSHGPCWVTGPTGSGRRLVLDRLQSRENVLALQPPPLEHSDAALHLLLQAAARADESALDVAQDDPRPIGERARDIAMRVAPKILVIRIPASWKLRGSRPSRVAMHPDAYERQRRATDLLDAWVSTARVVLLTARNFHLGSLAGAEPIVLPAMHAPEAGWTDPTTWGPLLEHARAFRDAVDDRLRTTLSPLQVRLSVALVALGESPTRLVSALASAGPSLAPLEQRLVATTQRRPRLSAVLRRFATARVPIEVGELDAVIGDGEDAALVKRCFGYGERQLVMNDYVRAALRGQWERDRSETARAALDDAHVALADVHEKLDGANRPPLGPRVVHWLEKVHHLAHGGPTVDGRWEQLRGHLRNRELLVDRARALSIERRDYAAAAELYAQCVGLDERDAYAQHYLGFNLDRAGSNAATAERSLRAAVAIEPVNPWWNSRLVTFLIDQMRYATARKEWLDALDRVDPDRTLVTDGSWLARSLHRWVVRAWLDRGELELAREAFESIPVETIHDDRTGILQELQERLLDAEEAVDLGKAVYPPAVAVEDRWKEPVEGLPRNTDSGAALVHWYPGRVLGADGKDGVVIAVATPEAEPERRRVIVRTIAPEDWKRWAWGTPASAGGYLQVGRYDDDATIIVPVASSRPPWRRARAEQELRYMRRWSESSS